MDEAADLRLRDRGDQGAPSASSVATIYDKRSCSTSQLDGGEAGGGGSVEQDFVFTAHDLFSITGSNHSAHSYGWLSEPLER